MNENDSQKIYISFLETNRKIYICIAFLSWLQLFCGITAGVLGWFNGISVFSSSNYNEIYDSFISFLVISLVLLFVLLFFEIVAIVNNSYIIKNSNTNNGFWIFISWLILFIPSIISILALIKINKCFVKSEKQNTQSVRDNKLFLRLQKIKSLSVFNIWILVIMIIFLIIAFANFIVFADYLYKGYLIENHFMSVLIVIYSIFFGLSVLFGIISIIINIFLCVLLNQIKENYHIDETFYTTLSVLVFFFGLPISIIVMQKAKINIELLISSEN